MNFDRDVAFSNKIRIIDLLNKIANGEDVPKKIKYNGEILKNNGYDNDYVDEDGDCLFQEYHWLKSLNENVEIIEEDKEIEKLNDILRVDDLEPPYDCNLEKIWVQTIKNHNKINELIDKVNSLEKRQ